jgi:hypothetical protein
MAKKKEAEVGPEYQLDPDQARTHSKRNRDAVRASLRELGAGRSIVVDKNGVIIGGNTVYEEAKKLGLPMEEIESDGSKVIVVRRIDLDTADLRRVGLAIADNQIGTLGDFDQEKLDELLLRIDGEIALETLGFEDEIPAEEFPEYDEHVTDDVKYNVCPKCGFQWPL